MPDNKAEAERDLDLARQAAERGEIERAREHLAQAAERREWERMDRDRDTSGDTKG